MNLISLNSVHLKYGVHPLLEGVELYIHKDDRLAIVGRNGSGKTSLMKIIAGIIPADKGLVERARQTTVAYLPQEVPVDLHGSVYSVVASGLGKKGTLLGRYHELLPKIEGDHSVEEQKAFDHVLHLLDETGAWADEPLVSETIERLELNGDSDVSRLSAGLKRRVLLGKGLVGNPDVLILDEPTNHLDLDSVIWLENFLKNCGKTLVFVSHDRAFLQSLATRVVEVDRGRLVSFDCDYRTFTERREEFYRVEEQQQALFDKKLAQEEVWIRQGIKARRTRNEGRVRALEKLRSVRRERRSRVGQVNLNVQDAELSGQKVMDVAGVTAGFDGRVLINDFSTTIYRGDKIGIIGRNGVGKTTLLNILLGKYKPDKGTVEHGTSLQIAYFDQLRRQLDPKSRLCDIVGEGNDFVTVNGQKRNIIGYLQDFLFSPEQIRGEVSMLSGGERNRLLLAMLFTKPANVLVLDEPTNDLDAETLELLESTLVDFDGTILLVSHDRTFLNNIVTGVFCFEEGGHIVELVGGYDDWERYRKQQEAKTANDVTVAATKPEKKLSVTVKREKFTNRERAELENIPSKIDGLEKEQGDLVEKLADPDFLKSDPEKVKAAQRRLSEIETEHEQLFERWSFLEERQKQLEG